MEEDFRDKNLVKKGSGFEYNVLDDNSADQVPIEFVPMETTTRKAAATREGKKILSKTGETTKTGQTNKARTNDMPVSSPRKRVTKKKLKLGGGLVSKGFRGSTSARSYYHNVRVLQLAFLSILGGYFCAQIYFSSAEATMLQLLQTRFSRNATQVPSSMRPRVGYIRLRWVF